MQFARAWVYHGTDKTAYDVISVLGSFRITTAKAFGDGETFTTGVISVSGGQIKTSGVGNQVAWVICRIWSRRRVDGDRRDLAFGIIDAASPHAFGIFDPSYTPQGVIGVRGGEIKTCWVCGARQHTASRIIAVIGDSATCIGGT